MSGTSGVCGSSASSTTSAPQTRTQPRRWTAAEDKFLTQLVAKFGDKRGSNGHWKEISSRFNTRTAKVRLSKQIHNSSSTVYLISCTKDCRKRWFHSLDPSLRKGRWCESEDRILLDAYNQLGPAWRDTALLLPGRKDDQCSKRYREILSPAVRNRLCEWTTEEDRLLLEGVRSFGHSWSAISARIPGRPPLTCRNRWRVVSKRSQRGDSEGGNAGHRTIGNRTPDPLRPQSLKENGTVSQSIDSGSQSTAAVANDEDSSNLELEADPFVSSYSAVTEGDLGTSSTLGDMAHSFDSFLREFYESQSTSALLTDMSNTVVLPEGSPGPAAVSNQSSHQGISPDVETFDQGRGTERRAELEAETMALRQHTEPVQIGVEGITPSGQAELYSDWHSEHAASLEGGPTAAALTNSPGRVAPTRRPLVREIHHHHHHQYHHYHHHHYHD